MTSSNNNTFLGLTKFQFTIIAVAVALLCAAVSSFALTYSVRANRERMHDTRELADANNRSFCAFKKDIQRRINGALGYLAAHPNGTPGIPASVIRNSLANQQQTLKSLSSLNCKETS